jgi:hypothetical protein
MKRWQEKLLDVCLIVSVIALIGLLVFTVTKITPHVEQEQQEPHMTCFGGRVYAYDEGHTIPIYNSEGKSVKCPR